MSVDPLAEPGVAHDPTTTAECRWWAPGRSREEFVAWFTTLGEVDVEADRVDHYLLDEARADRNVKLRDGTRREVKLRVSRAPIRSPDVAGWLERWSKRSFPQQSVQVVGTRVIAVRKRRRLITLDEVQVELTEVFVDGRRWHSLALEAIDEPPGSETLEPVVRQLVGAAVTRFMPLSASRSRGYAHHLLATCEAGGSVAASPGPVLANARTSLRGRPPTPPALDICAGGSAAIG